MMYFVFFFFFFQEEDGIRDSVASRGLGDVYRGQEGAFVQESLKKPMASVRSSVVRVASCFGHFFVTKNAKLLGRKQKLIKKWAKNQCPPRYKGGNRFLVIQK